MRRRGATLAAAAALCAGALLGAGCPDNSLPPEVEVYSVTTAPPARTAVVVNQEGDHHIQMSRGVALGLGCWDNCKGSCEAPTFSVADTEVAAVRSVFRSSGYPTYVLVAKTAGRTEVTVSTACASQVYQLTVADDQP
jgi:hypothetical protein